MNRYRLPLIALAILASPAVELGAQPVINSAYSVSPIVSSATQSRSLATLRDIVSRVPLRAVDDPDYADQRLIGGDHYQPRHAIFASSWLTDLGQRRYNLVVDFFGYPITSESEEDGIIISLERGGDLLQSGLRSPTDLHPFNGGGGIGIGYESGLGDGSSSDAVQFATPTYLEQGVLIAADAEDNVIGSATFSAADLGSGILNADGSWDGTLYLASPQLIDVGVNRIQLTLTLYAPYAVPEPSAAAIVLAALGGGLCRRR